MATDKFAHKRNFNKVKPIYTKNRTVALLGGSFNPAHAGHLHISEYALKTLGVDEIWWLVSPKNPLKSADSLANYSERFASAIAITKHNKHIFVSNIEQNLNTNYTYQTLTKLKKRYNSTNFIWLMGADNLENFHLWQHWQDILKLLPIVVFDRSPYSFTSIASKTYLRMHRFLLNNHHSARNHSYPSLRFIRLRRSAHSATVLRKTLGIKAFIGHNSKYTLGK